MNTGNPFILDQAADDDDDAYDSEPENLDNDDDFNNEVSAFREYQSSQESLAHCNIFSDLIHCLETWDSREQDSAMEHTIVCEQDFVDYSEHNGDNMGQAFYDGLRKILHEHPEAPLLSAKYLVYHLRCLVWPFGYSTLRMILIPHLSAVKKRTSFDESRRIS